jgi:two-component system sensor histidine kinase GlrK
MKPLSGTNLIALCKTISNTHNNPHVSNDRAIIEELFDIVLHNAIKFVPESGFIEIEVSREGNYFNIFIKDNGPGIDKYKSTSSDPMSGSGMGLRVARQYAALLKGKLSHAPLEPTGTCFQIQLPDFAS